MFPNFLKASCLFFCVLGVGWVSSVAESSKKPSIPERTMWSLQFSPDLATLGVKPTWSDLDAWQETITRSRFETLLNTHYTSGPDAWADLIEITPSHAAIVMASANPKERYLLRFAETDNPRPPRFWRALSELPANTPERPLTGLRIALDPGHMGGSWARMEERFFQLGDDPPVQEGDMVLQVGKLLEARLHDLGATVLWVRDQPGPVTMLRPEALEPYTRAFLQARGQAEPMDPLVLEKVRNRIFCVNAEIRARAQRVNSQLKPDLVLALHFNGEPWGAADKPVFAEKNHLHVLVHGCLERKELRHDDERFEMLVKLLQGTERLELDLATNTAEALAAATDLPPFTYNGSNARRVNTSPFVWARNLLASRIYQCPVIYLEPHVMNHALTYERIQAGAYQGKKHIAGKERENLYAEYATAVAHGLVAWRENQPTTPCP